MQDLHAELIKILNQPEEFRQFMLADLAKWAKVVKESGIKLK